MKQTIRKKKPLTVLLQGVMASLVLSCTVSLTAAAQGWEKAENDDWRYQNEDGSYLADNYTPDGYYMDGNGIWTEKREFLGVDVLAPNSFQSASQIGSLADCSDMFSSMLKRISEDCGDVRGAAFEEGEVIWFLKEDRQERELFRFYKIPETDAYALRLKCSLTREKGTDLRISWYDHQVLSGLLCRISASGAQLADAIYSSWEENNLYGLKAGKWVRVGDAMIKYESVSGAGIYEIRAAEGGR